MTIFIFGNQDLPQDNLAFLISKKLENLPGVNFKSVDPNGDLPISGNGQINIIDTIMGIDKVTLLTEKDLNQLVLSPRTTAHDYDLGFQLKYLTKIGRLKKVNVIGLPMNGKINYDLIHSILRKLVAQDIQGS